MKDFFDLERNERALAFFLILPTIIAVFGVLIFPLLYSLAISFSSVTLRNPAFNFVGLRNYAEGFSDPKLAKSFLLTLRYTVSTVMLKLVMGMCLALVLNEKFCGRGLGRSLIIIPWAVPYVVAGITWRWIFDADIGILNFLLKKAGLIDNYIAWMSTKGFALWTVVIADVWQGTPFFCIILLAGLQIIPKELYEAAEIDGAGSVRKFIYVTLPLIKFQIFISAIIGSIFAINQFDLFFVLTKGGPATYTLVATYYDYKIAFAYFRINYASAVSYLILIMSLMIGIIYMNVLHKMRG